MVKTTEQALKAGALVPISTETRYIRDSGVDFCVRIVSNLQRKLNFSAADPDTWKDRPDPFLPYEEDLFVGDISDTHVCLLNKFNVIDHHVLMVTRAFEDQETLLTRQDFAAACICLAEFDGLVFYNGGRVAGASQPHKHLQMIPLPIADKGPKVPMEALFPSAPPEDHPTRVPGLPFLHAFAGVRAGLMADPLGAAPVAFTMYRKMLETVGLNVSSMPERSRQSGPYNLLFTREWMLLVPRSREFFGSMSVNALGFAGALLVSDEEQMRRVEAHGGMSVLRHTAVVAG